MANESRVHARSGRDNRPSMQARARRTRDAILDVASVQFDQVGYAETSINTIVAGSSLTKGAIYFHFSSKAAIALCLVDTWGHVLQHTIAATSHVETSATERIRVIFSDLARLVVDDRRLRAGMKLTLEPSVDASTSFNRWVDAVGELVELAVVAGELEDLPRNQRLAWNLCSAIAGIVQTSTIAYGEIDLVIHIDDLIAAHLSSVRNSALL